MLAFRDSDTVTWSPEGKPLRMFEEIDTMTHSHKNRNHNNLIYVSLNETKHIKKSDQSNLGPFLGLSWVFKQPNETGSESTRTNPVYVCSIILTHRGRKKPG